MPNTAKVIYSWGKKILSFSNNSKFCKQKIYKNDHIIDIHVNTEVLTTGLVIPSGTKRTPAVDNTLIETHVKGQDEKVDIFSKLSD